VIVEATALIFGLEAKTAGIDSAAFNGHLGSGILLVVGDSPVKIYGSCGKPDLL
jgi:hypothetical protein